MLFENSMQNQTLEYKSFRKQKVVLRSTFALYSNMSSGRNSDAFIPNVHLLPLISIKVLKWLLKIYCFFLNPGNARYIVIWYFKYLRISSNTFVWRVAIVYIDKSVALWYINRQYHFKFGIFSFISLCCLNNFVHSDVAGYF